MHTLGPLNGDDDPFQPWKKVKRERDAANRKDAEKYEWFRSVRNENNVEERSHQVTDDQNCQIGRTVIGAMVV